MNLQDGASEISGHKRFLSVDDLADQVAEVLDHFWYALFSLHYTIFFNIHCYKSVSIKMRFPFTLASSDDH